VEGGCSAVTGSVNAPRVTGRQQAACHTNVPQTAGVAVGQTSAVFCSCRHARYKTEVSRQVTRFWKVRYGEVNVVCR